MTIIPESKVLNACQVLFGAGVKLDREFLVYLQPGGARAAYRKRAKEIHPDLLQRSSPESNRQGAELFRQLVEARELISEFFRQRESGQWRLQHSSLVAAVRPSGRPPGTRHSSEAAGPHAQERVPAVSLTIGRYCYYRGVVPYAVLLEAVTWQRRQRPLLGEIARRWGWLDETGIRWIATRGNQPGRFGEKAVALGLLAPEQVRALLFYQRAQQKKIGRYFIERGFLSEPEMDRLVAELEEHNRRTFRGAAPF